jgi:hypothetical protein
MSWIKIIAYAFDYQPGSTGIVYFKCQGEDNGRKTPELQPDVFNAVSAVLQKGPTIFETDNHIFRSDGYQGAGVAPTIKNLTSEDFKNIEKFDTWTLPNKEK